MRCFGLDIARPSVFRGLLNGDVAVIAVVVVVKVVNGLLVGRLRRINCLVLRDGRRGGRFQVQVVRLDLQWDAGGRSVIPFGGRGWRRRDRMRVQNVLFVRRRVITVDFDIQNGRRVVIRSRTGFLVLIVGLVIRRYRSWSGRGLDNLPVLIFVFHVSAISVVIGDVRDDLHAAIGELDFVTAFDGAVYLLLRVGKVIARSFVFHGVRKGIMFLVGMLVRCLGRQLVIVVVIVNVIAVDFVVENFFGMAR